MDPNFDIVSYLTGGVERVVKSLLKLSDFSPREAVFMAQYAKASKLAAQKRRASADAGQNIPPFLICSITTSCNLHCAGCYARSLDGCSDEEPVQQMTADEWDRIFREAAELGVGFILLAGGEPMVRRDVLLKAAETKDILFPIFTNGTMFSERALNLFDENRNLVPILSIEGEESTTDARRGEGVYRKLLTGMDSLKARKIAFGASITVTNENLAEITSDDYIARLNEKGCKAVIYVEYVPTNPELKRLALSEAEQAVLASRISELREAYDKMLFVSFPGDEKSSGGCIAAGRGFFHINSHGGAEPCPFSPYSDVNVRDGSLLDAMQSKLFRALQSGEVLMDAHVGGCVLFEKREQVEAILNS